MTYNITNIGNKVLMKMLVFERDELSWDQEHNILLHYMKITVHLDVTPSNLLDRYQRFGGTGCLPLHGSPEDAVSVLHRNVGNCLQIYTVSHPRSRQSA